LAKGFQRIRYYGLQATCMLKQMRTQLITALDLAVQQVMDVGEVSSTQPRYRQRMLSAFGCDPLICVHCGRELWLWQIWHPQYGVIYDQVERMKAGMYERVERPVCRPTEPDRARDARALSDGYVQIALFSLSARR